MSEQSVAQHVASGFLQAVSPKIRALAGLRPALLLMQSKTCHLLMKLSSKNNDFSVPVLILLVGILLMILMAQAITRSQTQEANALAELNAKAYSGYLASNIERGIAITHVMEQAVIRNCKILIS